MSCLSFYTEFRTQVKSKTSVTVAPTSSQKKNPWHRQIRKNEKSTHHISSFHHLNSPWPMTVEPVELPAKKIFFLAWARNLVHLSPSWPNVSKWSADVCSIMLTSAVWTLRSRAKTIRHNLRAKNQASELGINKALHPKTLQIRRIKTRKKKSEEALHVLSPSHEG